LLERGQDGAVGARTLARAGRHQREAGEKEAIVVQTLKEAYRVLGLKRPRFEPFDGR